MQHLTVIVNGAAISFFKYFKFLLEISSIPELDFGFKSLIIAKVTSAVISLKHSLDFGLLFKYRE